jgi:NADH dehydrogenase
MRQTTVRNVATVFGGAGFIGRYVVQRLAALEYVVRVAGRDPAKARFLQTQGAVGQIVPLAASLGDEVAAARAIAGADLVVNLVGILAERKAGDFRRVHVEGAGRIARLAAELGAERLVHVSAIGADPDSPSLYGRSKAEGEAAVRAAFPGATILFGPEDQFFNRFAGLARMLPFMPVVAGGARFQPVYVGDVADAAIAAATRADAMGRTYELGGPRGMTFREVLRFILDTTGHRRPMVELPEALVKLQVMLGKLLPNPPLTEDQLLMLRRDNVVAPGAAGLAELGITPKAVEAVVPGYLMRFRAGGGRRPKTAS